MGCRTHLELQNLVRGINHKQEGVGRSYSVGTLVKGYRHPALWCDL